jgi:hypothetical protein
LRQSTGDKSFARAYRDYLLKEARRAFIEREANIVRLSMHEKGVDVLPVSATEYQSHLGCEDADEQPKISPEATGLPQLRRYLFHLPAQTNFRTLRHHVFETLPDIVGRIQRINKKFESDGGSEHMRQKFDENLPGLRKIFAGLAESLPDECVTKPFTQHEIDTYINPRLEQFVSDLCTSKGVYYQTFSKMLRENGIPTNGSGLGRNLNNEILNTMVQSINAWHVSMQGKTCEIAERLDEPSKAVLKALREHIQSSRSNREVTNRVNALLDTTIRRLGISYGKLTVRLLNELREIHLRHSTEVNVKCPIAMEMKYVYRTVILEHLGQPGTGSYNRQRTHLLKCLTIPDSDGRTLPRVIG